MLECILVLAVLTTESSYASEIERPATAVADTVQFWFGSSGAWRVRTYAIDHDIHVYQVGASGASPTFQPQSAEAHIKKHYSDVLAKLVVLRFKEPNDKAEVEQILAVQGLSGTLEVAPAGFAFYNPDSVQYETKSEPK
jgi:hypothetical protein